MCNKHTWYLDAVINLDLSMRPTLNNTDDKSSTLGYPASVESDLYLTKGCYVGIEGNLILFDSGCTMTVTPYLNDFIGGIKYVKEKEMQDLLVFDIFVKYIFLILKLKLVNSKL